MDFLLRFERRVTKFFETDLNTAVKQLLDSEDTPFHLGAAGGHEPPGDFVTFQTKEPTVQNNPALDALFEQVWHPRETDSVEASKAELTYSLFFRKVFEQRQFVRLAALSAHVAVGDSGQAFVVRSEPGDQFSSLKEFIQSHWDRVIMITGSQDGAARPMGAGRIEYYVSVRSPYQRFIIASHGLETVVAKGLSNKSDESINDWLPSALFDNMEDVWQREVGRDILNKDKLSTSPTLEGAADFIDTMYVHWALNEVKPDKRDIAYNLMREDGIAGLLSNDEGNVECLARISLLGYGDPEAKKVLEQTTGWELDVENPLWEHVFNQTSFRLLIVEQGAFFCCV